jgi:hypothetical protein
LLLYPGQDDLIKQLFGFVSIGAILVIHKQDQLDGSNKLFKFAAQLLIISIVNEGHAFALLVARVSYSFDAKRFERLNRTS